MKIFALLVSILLILSLASQLESRLLLTNGKGFFCLWSTKRTCSKTSPRCIRVLTAAGTYSCKYYRSDCQYLLDSCKGKTVFGLIGTSVDVQTNCVTNGINLGETGTC
ncbi:hypothetical protein KR009_008957 [Drosophila setifemur]|nr:hypothetical protein KR009_008957 [Drosophila setifemur]